MPADAEPGRPRGVGGMTDGTPPRAITEEWTAEFDWKLQRPPELVPLILTPSLGWPPRPADLAHSLRHTPILGPGGLSPEEEREIYNRVMQDKRVERLVADGAQLLAHHLEWADVDTNANTPARTRLIFVSGTERVEVVSVGGEVQEIRDVSELYHPESIKEVAAAILLAAQHETLRDEVVGLAAHAILAEPQHQLTAPAGHRILEVMFTEDYDEDVEPLVLFSAFVDVTAGTVLYAGRAESADAENSVNLQDE